RPVPPRTGDRRDRRKWLPRYPKPQFREFATRPAPSLPQVAAPRRRLLPPASRATAQRRRPPMSRARRVHTRASHLPPTTRTEARWLLVWEARRCRPEWRPRGRQTAGRARGPTLRFPQRARRRRRLLPAGHRRDGELFHFRETRAPDADEW